MPRGGKRQGAGRPKGRKNGEGKPAKAINSKRTRAQTGQIVERALQHGDLTPLEAMLRNLRVIVAEAERMLEAGVPVTDKDHFTLRKLATRPHRLWHRSSIRSCRRLPTFRKMRPRERRTEPRPAGLSIYSSNGYAILRRPNIGLMWRTPTWCRG